MGRSRHNGWRAGVTFALPLGNGLKRLGNPSAGRSVRGKDAALVVSAPRECEGEPRDETDVSTRPVARRSAAATRAQAPSRTDPRLPKWIGAPLRECTQRCTLFQTHLRIQPYLERFEARCSRLLICSRWLGSKHLCACTSAAALADRTLRPTSTARPWTNRSRLWGPEILSEYFSCQDLPGLTLWGVPACWGVSLGERPQAPMTGASAPSRTAPGRGPSAVRGASPEPPAAAHARSGNPHEVSVQEIRGPRGGIHPCRKSSRLGSNP